MGGGEDGSLELVGHHRSVGEQSLGIETRA